MHSGGGRGDPQDIFDLLAGPASEPDAEALRFLPSGDPTVAPVRLTRQAFAGNVARTVRVLRELGVAADDVVSLMAPNLMETQAVFWAAEMAGAVNPINFLLSSEHIAHILRTAGTKVLVTVGPEVSPEIWAKASAAAAQAPSVRSVLTLGPGVPPGALSYATLLERVGDSSLAGGNRRRPQDIAAYFHTGGTTGAPKLVAHTHGAQIRAALDTAESYGFAPGEVVLCGLPMFHVAAPILATLAPLSAGATVLMPTAAGNRDPQVIGGYWRIVEANDVTFVGGVPTTLSDILEKSGEPPRDTGRGRVCMTGGAQLPRALQARFEAVTGIPVRPIYGMTETAGVIAAAPRHERTPLGAVGRPVRGVEVSVRRVSPDGASGAPCAPGETGEILVRGANVTPGYLAPSRALVPVCDADGWLRTGDLGSLDAEGWLYVTGRSKDVIIRSGHNLDPAAIEEVARGHADVVEAAAVGRPDPRAGEVPVLFVVLRPGVDAEAAIPVIHAFMNARVPEAPAKPAAVYAAPHLPLTAVGKLFRPALQAEALRRYAVANLATHFPDGAPCELSVEVQASGALRLVIAGVPDPRDERWAGFETWLAAQTFEVERRGAAT